MQYDRVSSVTHGAMGRARRRGCRNLQQLVAERGFVVWRRPSHIGDLIVRAQMRRRIAVAVEAEAHVSALAR